MVEAGAHSKAQSHADEPPIPEQEARQKIRAYVEAYKAEIIDSSEVEID